MIEWTIEQWDVQQTEELAVLYLYTPMCGTCAVASKMIDVVEQLLPDIAMGKANLNYVEQLAYRYEIESVPCLLVARKGEITDKVYAFQSVLNLYEILKK